MASRCLWRVHGSLNFVRKPTKVPVQPVVNLALYKVRREVPDKGGVSRIRAKFFD